MGFKVIKHRDNLSHNSDNIRFDFITIHLTVLVAEWGFDTLVVKDEILKIRGFKFNFLFFRPHFLNHILFFHVEKKKN